MEPLFISQWTHDNHSLYELVPIFRKHPSRIFAYYYANGHYYCYLLSCSFGEYLVFKITHGLFLCQACFYFIYVFIDPYLRIHNSFKNKNDFEKFLFIMIRFKFKYTTITKLLYPLPMHIHLLPLSQQLLLFVLI